MKKEAIIQEIESSHGSVDKFLMKKKDYYDIPSVIVEINDIKFSGINLVFNMDFSECFVFFNHRVYGLHQIGYFKSDSIKTFKIHDLKTNK